MLPSKAGDSPTSIGRDTAGRTGLPLEAAKDKIDYRPTQALMAEIKSMPDDQIDGIRYRSAVRRGGTSYVLFV